MKKFGLLMMVAALSTGCASQQEKMEELVGQAMDVCDAVGITYGDPQRESCVLEEYRRAEAKRDRSNRAMGAAIQKAGQDYSNTMRAQQCANNPYC
mgnify:CR=1 FL=1|tara:strand:- start:903 stop:1190 length:288 start_codon:yes stop_codon:yes gene_type:complete